MPGEGTRLNRNKSNAGRRKTARSKENVAAVRVLLTTSQYSEWTVGPLGSVTCAPMFMQFTGCHQPVQGFYWPENAIANWLRKC